MTEEDHLMLDVDVSKGEKIFNYKTFRQEHFVSVVCEMKFVVEKNTYIQLGEKLCR